MSRLGSISRWDAWILVGAQGFEGSAIDLLEWQEPPPTGSAPAALFDAGFQRIGVRVADLDATIANATAHGGTAWSEPLVHDIPGGGHVRIVMMSDPDGVVVELIEGGNGLAFVSVACADLEHSVGFYATLDSAELARFPSTRDTGDHLRIAGPLSMVEVLMGAPGGGEVHLMLAGFEQPQRGRGRTPRREHAGHVASGIAAPRPRSLSGRAPRSRRRAPLGPAVDVDGTGPPGAALRLLPRPRP